MRELRQAELTSVSGGIVTVSSPSPGVVNLTYNVAFEGPAATAANISTVVNQVTSTLSQSVDGVQVNVTVNQVNPSTADPGTFNVVNLYDTNVPSSAFNNQNNGHSFTATGVSGQPDTSYISMADVTGGSFHGNNNGALTHADNAAPGAHEFGHLAGLSDQNTAGDIMTASSKGGGTHLTPTDLATIEHDRANNGHNDFNVPVQDGGGGYTGSGPSGSVDDGFDGFSGGSSGTTTVWVQGDGTSGAVYNDPNSNTPSGYYQSDGNGNFAVYDNNGNYVGEFYDPSLASVSNATYGDYSGGTYDGDYGGGGGGGGYGYC